MGHGAAKHAKPYLMNDETQFSDISKPNLEAVPTAKDKHQAEAQTNKQNLMSQIKNAVSWPRKYETEHTTELHDSVQQLLETATKEMTALTKEKKYSQVEEIAQAIIRLTTQWGEEILVSLNLKSFIREMIILEVKGIKYTIQAGEYLKGEPFYAGDNRLVKLYYFHVSELISKCRIMSYFLECSNVIQPYFELGLSVSGSHLRVYSYDRSCPSYWVIRETVLRDMKSRINARLHARRETTTKSEEQESEEDLREGVQV